jgi:PmbA protein
MSQDQSLRPLAERVIDLAKAKGADQCDVLCQRGKSFGVSVQQGEIDKYKVSSAAIVGLRLIKDQRVGLTYSESFDGDALQTMVDQAIDNARFVAEDEWQRIDAQEPVEWVEDRPDIYQPDTVDLQEKMAFARRLEQGLLKADDRVASAPYNGYSDGEGEAIYLNHHGVYRYQRERSFQCYVAALTRDGDRQAMYGHSCNGRRFEDLDAKACIDGALSYALPLLNAKPIATGRYDLVFEPDELDQFLSCFIGTLSAKDILEGKSSFRQSLGEQIASPVFTLRDEPQYDRGFFYSRFDDEGVMRQPLTLITDGVLTSFFHNTATARQMEGQSTGHGSRSAKSALGVAPTQLVIATGQTPEAKILGSDHLRVVSLKGLHSGTNPISGHFSLAVEGVLYKGGEPEQFVKDVTISGNFYDFIRQIAQVGEREHANSSRTFFTPYMLFEGVSVAGS